MPIIRFQLRRGTAAEWASANPVLGGGEPGLETDTGKVKYGDGVSAWAARPYSSLTAAERQSLLDNAAGSATAAAGSASTATAQASLAELYRTDAETARTAAQAARDAAQAVPTTTDGLVKGLLDNPGSATAVALTATYVPANPTLVVTYNPDGTVASTTENGVLTTFTYNPDASVATQTRAGVTKTFTYDASGNVTGAA